MTKVKSKDDTLEKMKSLIIQYKMVFESPEGKKVLYDLMATHNVLNGTFDKDPMSMAFKEGARFVIMDILAKINTDPEKFIQKYEESMGSTF